MANDSRPGRKIADGENNNNNNTNTSQKELRRSTRESSSLSSSSSSSSRKQTPPSSASLNNRKSERLEKRVPITPPTMKKSVERVENQEKTQSPLRRSDRGKKQFQENRIISDVKNKKGEDVMKIAEKLTFESKKVSQSDREEQPIVGSKRNRMDSRSYKAIFKKQGRRKIAPEDDDVAQLSKPSVVDISSGGTSSADDVDEIGEDLIEESVENACDENDSDMGKTVKNVEVELSFSSLKHNEVSDGYGVKNKKDKNTLNDSETCNACFKRRRVDHDSENENLCSCKGIINKGLHAISEDRGELDECDRIIQGNKTPSDYQTNVDETKCIICKRGGNLRRCDGKSCKQNYHLSCLNPPVHDEPVGIRHCNQCVMKKIEKGVHSVSKGVESIWDFRESEVSDTQGCRMQKQYLVKYEGLAHVHNKWVPESELLLEATMLVTNFKLKNQDVKWNPDWTMPHKLLKKRLLMPLEEHGRKTLNCLYEWLVKWRGLDYNHASWELENSSFLKSTESQRLLKEYENRMQRALDASASSNESNMEPLSKLPAGCQPGVDNASLSIVSKLGEYWRKGKSAMFFDEQERAKRIILYILSFSNLTKPFLIITTSNYLSHWEAEFSRLEPSIDVLVYIGNKDNRNDIRNFEFYEEGGRIMFQVLLSSVEAVVEDLQMLQTLKWESIIVDECQRPRMSRHFKQIKKLSTYSKVLIFSAPIKESIIEYHNLISFLDDSAVSDGNLGKLKESVKEYIAYECKFSKFVEYWLPVQISNLQLEQYCATLLKNDSASALCSTLKNDPLVAVRDTLISSRKCCDHPYLVDLSIQTSLTKDLEPAKYLDVGIQASGKLQLLDEILSELKKRQLGVVILYQCIGGTGQDLMGDILDDFLRQRFGQDSYERINAFVKNSMKIEAMNKFNDKENNRFVFLIEYRACLSTVKLCSVDSIVIFNSDFHPYNDLKALQKITIDSQFQQIKIFRLYSSFTVEEMILISAKQNLALDASTANRSSTLLMWGASYLFKKLDEFHISNITDVSSEPSILNNVFKEFVGVISQNDEFEETGAMIVQVQYDSRRYRTSFPLLGETKIQLAEREKPHVFWSKLLDGTNPRWKFLPWQNQRQRKRGQVFTELPEKIGGENDEVGKKQKKMASLAKLPEGPNADNGPHSLPKSVAIFTDTIDVGPASNFLISDVRSPSPKNLHLLVKPDLLRLCEILKLSDHVKVLVGKFLEYVVESHQVSREPESIFQAFQISMCWIGASLLKHKIDKKESLALAKNHLQFICKEEEAESVYSKLRLMKKDFILKNPSLTSGALNAQLSDVKPKVVEKLQMIERKCEKRMAKLIQNQQEEIKEFNKSWDNKMLDLENKHKLEAAVVRTIHHNNASAWRDKVKGLEEDLKKRKDELQQKKDMCLNDLEAKHLKERLDEKFKASNWLAKASGAADNLEEVLPPGTTEILPPVTAETVERGNVNVVLDRETANMDEGNCINDGNSPSMPAVTSESPLSQDVEYQNERSQPLHSTGACAGSPPEAAPHANQSSVTPVEIPPSINIDGRPISPAEPPIVEPPADLQGSTPSQNIATSASATSASGPTPPNPARSGPTVSHNVAELPQPSGPALSLHADPLQNELDRIRSETEQTIKIHEDTKSKLKSDCGKEMEDMIAQIRKKYEVKFKDAEVAFRSKKKQLDDNHKKVSMSKVLAFAFRSKCSNFSPSPGINTQHQAGLSSFVQQVRRSTVPSAPRASAAPPAAALSTPRSSTVNHSPASGPPAATQLTATAAPCSSEVTGPLVGPSPSRTPAVRDPPVLPSATTQVRVSTVNSSPAGPPQATTQLPVPSAPRIPAVTCSPAVKGPPMVKGPPAITGSPAVKGPLVVPSAPKIPAVTGSPAITGSPAAKGAQAVPSATTQVKVSTVNSSPTGPPPFTTPLPVPSATRIPAVTGTGSPAAKGAPVVLSATTQVKVSTVNSSPAGPPPSTTPLPVPSATRIPAATISPAAPPLAATRQVPVPPLQVVSESAALFSSTPTRPLTITPITPSAGNHRPGGGEICAPAPLLQPFKPPPVSASSVTTLLRAMPRPPSPSPPPPPPPAPAQPPPAAQPPPPAAQLENPQTSMSAMELLMDVDRRSNVYISLPPLPDLDSNFAPLDLSEFGPPLTPALGTDNIVFLSDED